jgi:hypothetical protein
MGEVYRARDTRLSRSVALKVLPESLSDEPERLQRFEKEARSASALNHPNIVTIYEVGTLEGISYIAMELVEGKTLRELLHAGAIPLRRLLPLAAQMADGLAKAHEAGIVHRDLKPENVMVTKDSLVKILDFGLAKLTQVGAEDASSESQLQTMTKATEPGTILGTVGYMSPEQASGMALDARSDQFSLGSILYEMATGKRAFERGTKVQTLSAIVDQEPEAVGKVNPKLPANFCWIVERCLAKEPDGRYAATRDLARDLAMLRDHASEVTSAADIAVPVRRRTKRLWYAWVPAALALGLLLFLAGGRVGERRGVLARLPTFRQLTFRRGFLTGARFARDGQTVVYSAKWDGRPSEVFTTNVDSHESRPLGIAAGVLAISSAGELAVSLGCEEQQGECYGTLARVPLAGGAPRELLEDVTSADWSQDGRDLAVIHIVDGRSRLEYPIGKVLYQSNGSLVSLRYSPKGDLLAFVEYSSRESVEGTVCVIDGKGHRRALTPKWRGLWNLAWTPEGDGVIFSGAPSGQRRWLNLVKLSGEVRALVRPPGNTLIYDASREGRILVGAGYARGEIVEPADADIAGQKISWFDWSEPVDLSADGRSLLFREYGEGVDGKYVTFLRRLDGSDPSRLGDGRALALSSDQRWALVSIDDPDRHLRLLPTGVGQPRDLPGGGIGVYHWAFFLPDARRIAIAGEEKDRPPRSYIQDVDGGLPRPFGEEGLRISVVSPDGKQVAGTTLDGRALRFLIEGNGSDPKPIPGVEPGEFLVQWGVDGKTLYVRGIDENPLTLYRVDLDTGKRALWKQLHPAEEAGLLHFGAGPKSGVRITPDGRKLVYGYWTRQMDLYLADGLQSRWH